MKASQVPGDYWHANVHAEGWFLLCLGQGWRTGERELAHLHGRVWGREVTSGPEVMPKWSKEKGLSALTVPCKATCRQAKAECEKQLVSSIEANDGPYGVREQTDKMSSSKLPDSIYSRVQKSPTMKWGIPNRTL